MNLRKLFAKTELLRAGPVPDFHATLWREQHPEWNTDRCFQCGICYVSCPDGAVVLRRDGYYDMDPERCKGCGICAEGCPNEAIDMKPGR